MCVCEGMKGMGFSYLLLLLSFEMCFVVCGENGERGLDDFRAGVCLHHSG